MSAHQITRRQFIKRSGSIAAGAIGLPYLISASALGRSGTAAPSNRIVMGCIGVGGQGMVNLKNFLLQPDVQVVAVCDVCRISSDYYGGQTCGWEKAQKLVQDHYADQKNSSSFKGCEVYTDFRQLLARSDIDAVTVCSPDHWHGLISILAARAGKDIYCEKPLTNTIAEGRAVCDAVSRFHRVLQTGSHERSRPNARYACELVRNGYIGKLHTIRVNMPCSDDHHHQILRNNSPQPTMPIPDGLDYNMWVGPACWMPYTQLDCHFWWRFILNYGGGEMTDRGAHIIDLAQLGNGTDDSGPIEIFAQGSRPGDGIYDTFMDYRFEFQYANGVRLLGSTDSPRGLRFEGTDGWIFIHIHGGNLEAKPASLLNISIKPNEIHLGRSDGHHANFIDAVKRRKDPFAPAEVGHRSASICHLTNIAMLLGRRLRWDPVKEMVLGDDEANCMLARPMRSPWTL